MQKEETENAPLQIQLIRRCWKTCHEWLWKQPNAKNKKQKKTHAVFCGLCFLC